MEKYTIRRELALQWIACCPSSRCDAFRKTNAGKRFRKAGAQRQGGHAADVHTRQ